MERSSELSWKSERDAIAVTKSQVFDWYNVPKHANEALNLGSKSVELNWESKSIRGIAQIRASFLPRPRLILDIVVQVDTVAESFRLRFQDSFATPVIRLLDRGDSTECLVTKHQVGKGVSLTVTPTREPWILQSEKPLSRVQFLLVNFPEFHGEPLIVDDRSVHRLDKIELRASGWQVRLQSLDATRTLVAELKENGGYGVTHLGEITRGGDTFTANDASELLGALHFFLSFARGQWCSPVVAVGVDDAGANVWEAWGSGLIDQWGSRNSWFDIHHATSLGEVFPGFLSRWQDDTWRDPVHTAIYWYVHSTGTDVGVDGALVLSQAALEKLAWVKLAGDSKDATAAVRIRLLLTRLDIPTEIPTHLQMLVALGKEFNLDGPGVITRVRNEIVHPTQGSRYGSSYYEAWRLSLWYLELSLLRIFEYDGPYSNRLTLRWVGQVEPVPWSKKNSDG